MTYWEKERARPPEDVLKEAGFNVSEKCCSRPSCFDFAARKNGTLILVKVQLDIDNLSLGDSLELKAISECVSAASLLVGERAREKPLEDDTVYSRYEVSTVTPKTFESTIISKNYPLIHAGPGGYYVEIHSEAIKRRRQELGLSVGEMAEMVGISRRTLYGYERGMAKASVTAAYNLIYTLGFPVAKPINVFEKSREQRKCFLTAAKFAITKSKLMQKIFRKFTRCHITTVKKAPFDFVITVPEEKMRIIGGVANNKEQELNKRVDEILSVSRVVRAHPILITEERKPSKKDILCICKEELSKIKSPEDLISQL
ncbi:MAG: helix-turn-helix domain-containing protein [Candidatus Bathyarchaeia archaeon]